MFVGGTGREHSKTWTTRWNVRTTPRTTEPQQNFATQNVTHTYTRASTTYTDLLKNRWKTDMQFIFFLQSKK